MADTVAIGGDGASGDIIKTKPPRTPRELPDDVLIEIIDTILLDRHSDILESKQRSMLASVSRRWQIKTETIYLSRKSLLLIQPVDIPNFAHFFRYHWRANHLGCILFKIETTSKPSSLHLKPLLNMVGRRDFLTKEVEKAFDTLFCILKAWKLPHKSLSFKYIIHCKSDTGSCLSSDWNTVGLECNFSKLPELPFIRHLEQFSCEHHLGTTSASYLSLLSRLPAVQQLSMCCSIPECFPVEYTHLNTEHAEKFRSIPRTVPLITRLKLHDCYFQCSHAGGICRHRHRRVPPTLESSAARPLIESLFHRSTQFERLELKLTRMIDPALFFTVSVERTRRQGSPAWPKLRHLLVDGPYMTSDQGNVMKKLCEKENIRRVFPLMSRLQVSMLYWNDRFRLRNDVRAKDFTIDLDMTTPTILYV